MNGISNPLQRLILPSYRFKNRNQKYLIHHSDLRWPDTTNPQSFIHRCSPDYLFILALHHDGSSRSITLFSCLRCNELG